MPTPDLTPSQRKALIEAVTARWGGNGDAWDSIFNDNDREDATTYYLAGFRDGKREAQKEKR